MSCPLCKERENKDNYIASFKGWFLNFNRYPYLPGHLLLLPKEEKPNLFECSQQTKQQLGTVLGTCQKVLMDCLGYESCNIGVNTGGNSGASIPEHLHIHLVPRRKNDINFILACSESTDDGDVIPRESIQFFDNYGTVRNKIIGAFVDNIDDRLKKLEEYVPNKEVKRSSSE